VGRPPKLLGLGRGVSGLLDPLGRGRRFVPRSSIWGRRTGPNGATATNCSRGRRGALEQAGGIGGFGGRDDDSGGYCAARTGGGPRTIGRGGRERRRGELKRVVISSRVRTVSLVSARVLYLRVSVLLSWRCPPTVSKRNHRNQRRARTAGGVVSDTSFWAAYCQETGNRYCACVGQRIDFFLFPFVSALLCCGTSRPDATNIQHSTVHSLCCALLVLSLFLLCSRLSRESLLLYSTFPPRHPR
jgi:hypothetical protein